MPTKPLDRLIFVQGGLCFFCAKPLIKDEASVEHLVPSARGGSNHDDNCVACCKSMNSLLGSMSLKEKIKVVINQKGYFRCPNGLAQVMVGDVAAQSSAVPLAAVLPLSEVVIDGLSETPKKAIAANGERQSSVSTSENAIQHKPKDVLTAVIKDLKGRGKSKPLRIKTLTSTIKALPLNLSLQQVQTVVNQLKAQGKIVVSGTKVAYKL